MRSSLTLQHYDDIIAIAVIFILVVSVVFIKVYIGEKFKR